MMACRGGTCVSGIFIDLANGNAGDVCGVGLISVGLELWDWIPEKNNLKDWFIVVDSNEYEK